MVWSHTCGSWTQLGRQPRWLPRGLSLRLGLPHSMAAARCSDLLSAAAQGSKREYSPRLGVSAECALLGSVSSHRRMLEPWACHSSRTDRVIALRSWTDRVRALRPIRVTAPCDSLILFRKKQENTSSRHEGMPTQRHEEERGEACQRAGERERDPQPFGSPFNVFSSPPPRPALCKLG